MTSTRQSAGIVADIIATWPPVMQTADGFGAWHRATRRDYVTTTEQRQPTCRKREIPTTRNKIL